MNSEWRARYDRAIEAAHKAGGLALQHFGQPIDVELKSDQTPVTVADRAAEELLRKELGDAFPGDGFLGEEFGDQEGTSGYRWIIDPIDGTRSFVRGIPLWGTLVGLEYQGEYIAGVAHAPALGQTYHALREDGAYRDGRQIHVSNITTLDKALMAYSSASWFINAGKTDLYLEMVARTERSRGFGDFWGFMLVAQGSCDLMFEYGCSAWDLAALVPIIEEAGGRFTDWSGEQDINKPDVLASNGKIHDEALAILRQG